MPMYAPMERALTEFALNEETVLAFAEYNLWKGQLEDDVFIRPGQDMVMWGQDFSYNAGPLISPEMFETFYPSLCQRTGKRYLRTIFNVCIQAQLREQ